MKYIIAIQDAANDVLTQHVVESKKKLTVCEVFALTKEFETIKQSFEVDAVQDYDLAVKNNDLNALRDFEITLNVIVV